MKAADPHLSDEQLLLDLEGELSARGGKLVHAHVEACWKCRARREELSRAITNFARAYQPELPSGEGPRALLRARMAQLSARTRGRSPWFSLGQSALARWWGAAAALLLLLCAGIVQHGRETVVLAAPVFMPDSRLTPGATLLVSRPDVCALPGIRNKAVPASLQREVFREYGIPGADPRAYEVDYLVTPALGGADDIHNLWPHSYSAVWNARVKDELEERLRQMVCDGTLDLGEAQRDIATDWIAAYKKYFHTDGPLAEHRK